MESFPKLGQFKSPAALRQRLAELGWELPLDERILTADASPLAQRLRVGRFTVGNRFCIHPMEGWDAFPDGSPSELTLRRWRRFGESGAKWIWGGEAAAVQPDGRANPNQTLATQENRDGLARLLGELRSAHLTRYGTCDDLLVGLQLTHSGRFSKPGPKFAPRVAYHHPLLDARVGISPGDASVVWTDDDLERLIEQFASAAELAWQVGFQFVDVKACHGYLLHEFLSARRRPGRFGGDLEGRSRLLCTIVQRIAAQVPELGIVVRLSVYDAPPFESRDGRGQPLPLAGLLPYQDGFGVDPDNPLRMKLDEPLQLIAKLRDLGVMAVNITCGSPYYCPHLQRPAAFPPSDGYEPPEDPLASVCRLIDAARQCKQAFPDLPMVGTGYSYLQDYLPHVAQAVVREGWIDAVGLGRMALSYPHLPDDVLRHGVLERKRVCRTFSDCTTAPRNGMASGCYPLDAHYKVLPEAARLREIKARNQ